jgi:hypothetical protein
LRCPQRSTWMWRNYYTTLRQLHITTYKLTTSEYPSYTTGTSTSHHYVITNLKLCVQNTVSHSHSKENWHLMRTSEYSNTCQKWNLNHMQTCLLLPCPVTRMKSEKIMQYYTQWIATA